MLQSKTKKKKILTTQWPVKGNHIPNKPLLCYKGDFRVSLWNVASVDSDNVQEFLHIYPGPIKVSTCDRLVNFRVLEASYESLCRLIEEDLKSHPPHLSPKCLSETITARKTSSFQQKLSSFLKFIENKRELDAPSRLPQAPGTHAVHIQACKNSQIYNKKSYVSF